MNSGQRFNGGFNGELLLNAEGKTAWWASRVVRLGCRVVQLLSPFEPQTAALKPIALHVLNRPAGGAVRGGRGGGEGDEPGAQEGACGLLHPTDDGRPSVGDAGHAHGA